ncbi:uncharacterized protein LOC112905490 isoform X2 [Agrilus planipennis]|uniref:Uncharacterized protein LOC112905489 isoform X2 n=1 Tax=Agrilus planipennis TaxID=224129 RepID=A0A7F5RCX6_AGRPL|nr:uncharacterized protein LOC112905489 isoform X2 [Agrilus planipennis]XP_025833826.1 uncharacterized protein LOC112905490 isoform X2 [Agrilus planipennis]
MIQNKTDSNQNMNCSPNLNKIKEEETSLQSIPDSVPLATSSTTDLRFGYNDAVNPKICPNQPLSPARYRSLDTLTSNNAPQSELPEPGALSKITTPHRKVRDSITQSSPNIKLAVDLRDDPVQKNSSESKDYEVVKKLLRDSTELINKALDIIEQKDKLPVSPGGKIKKPPSRERNVTIKKFFETTLHRPSSVLPKVKQSYGSSPVLAKKQNRNDQTPSHASLTDISSNKVRLPSTSSIPSPRSPSKKTNSASASKIPGSASGNRPVRKFNSLYGHVKSTIPKPSSIKKDVNNK